MNKIFKIEKNVPVSDCINTRYPFGDMKVGDSFSCEADESMKMRTAAFWYGKRHNMKFTARIVSKSPKTYRCWRIA